MIAVLLGIIRQIPLKGLDLFIDPLYFVRVDGFRASRSDVGMPVSDLDSSDVEHLSVESMVDLHRRLMRPLNSKRSDQVQHQRAFDG